MSWTCAVCGGARSRPTWAVTSEETENGVSAEAFRPSADRFGETVTSVVACEDCGHLSLSERPSDDAIAMAYGDAADAVSIDEERGQVETARRALALLERFCAPGRLLDVGCWTGSFLVAAQARGWQVSGVEPSQWAVRRAHERGLGTVTVGSLADAAGKFDAVVLCDVLEHLLDPRHAVHAIHDLLVPDGLLLLTVPDAGSRLARVMGRRWWSVLPMHVQYFTRASLRRLLTDAGFDVETVRSHPKVFTAEYYAERLGGYSPPLARVIVRLLRALRLAQRLVAPDFHDRMLVIARRRR